MHMQYNYWALISGRASQH